LKLKLDETLEQSLEKLITRTKKTSFNNNKGLTKIQQAILLDSIDFIEHIIDTYEYKNIKKRT